MTYFYPISDIIGNFVKSLFYNSLFLLAIYNFLRIWFNSIANADGYYIELFFVNTLLFRTWFNSIVYAYSYYVILPFDNTLFTFTIKNVDGYYVMPPFDNSFSVFAFIEF